MWLCLSTPMSPVGSEVEDAEELTFVKLVPSPGLSAVHILPP